MLFGASVEGDFTGETPRLHPWPLLVSALISAVSLLISTYLMRLDRGNATSSAKK